MTKEGHVCSCRVGKDGDARWDLGGSWEMGVGAPQKVNWAERSDHLMGCLEKLHFSDFFSLLVVPSRKVCSRWVLGDPVLL